MFSAPSSSLSMPRLMRLVVPWREWELFRWLLFDCCSWLLHIFPLASSSSVPRLLPSSVTPQWAWHQHTPHHSENTQWQCKPHWCYPTCCWLLCCRLSEAGRRSHQPLFRVLMPSRSTKLDVDGLSNPFAKKERWWAHRSTNATINECRFPHTLWYVLTTLVLCRQLCSVELEDKWM